MDPRLNPYAPGAVTPPPELAGCDELIESASIAVGFYTIRYPFGNTYHVPTAQR